MTVGVKIGGCPYFIFRPASGERAFRLSAGGTGMGSMGRRGGMGFPPVFHGDKRREMNFDEMKQFFCVLQVIRLGGCLFEAGRSFVDGVEKVFE
jgi:hypothetical protein